MKLVGTPGAAQSLSLASITTDVNVTPSRRLTSIRPRSEILGRARDEVRPFSGAWTTSVMARPAKCCCRSGRTMDVLNIDPYDELRAHDG